MEKSLRSTNCLLWILLILFFSLEDKFLSSDKLSEEIVVVTPDVDDVDGFMDDIRDGPGNNGV